jgi:hypothetical protein
MLLHISLLLLKSSLQAAYICFCKQHIYVPGPINMMINSSCALIDTAMENTVEFLFCYISPLSFHNDSGNIPWMFKIHLHPSIHLHYCSCAMTSCTISWISPVTKPTITFMFYICFFVILIIMIIYSNAFCSQITVLNHYFKRAD